MARRMGFEYAKRAIEHLTTKRTKVIKVKNRPLCLRFQPLQLERCQIEPSLAFSPTKFTKDLHFLDRITDGKHVIDGFPIGIAQNVPFRAIVGRSRPAATSRTARVDNNPKPGSPSGIAQISDDS